MSDNKPLPAISMILNDPVEGCRTYSHRGHTVEAHYKKDFVYGKEYEDWKIVLNPGATHPIVASVVRNPGSYGSEYGLFELAFLKDSEFVDVFEGEWGDQVLGYLVAEEVERWIDDLMDRMGLD